MALFDENDTYILSPEEQALAASYNPTPEVTLPDYPDYSQDTGQGRNLPDFSSDAFSFNPQNQPYDYTSALSPTGTVEASPIAQSLASYGQGYDGRQYDKPIGPEQQSWWQRTFNPSNYESAVGTKGGTPLSDAAHLVALNISSAFRNGGIPNPQDTQDYKTQNIKTQLAQEEQQLKHASSLQSLIKNGLVATPLGRDIARRNLNALGLTDKSLQDTFFKESQEQQAALVEATVDLVRTNQLPSDPAVRARLLADEHLGPIALKSIAERAKQDRQQRLEEAIIAKHPLLSEQQTPPAEAPAETPAPQPQQQSPAPQAQRPANQHEQLGVQYNLKNPRLVTAIAGNEGKDSDPNVASHAGARGRYQIIPQTARQYLSPELQKLDDKELGQYLQAHPEVSTQAALLHMKDLEGKYPNRPDLQLAAYFSGSKNIDDKGNIISLTKHDGGKNGQGNSVAQYVSRGLAVYNGQTPKSYSEYPRDRIVYPPGVSPSSINPTAATSTDLPSSTVDTIHPELRPKAQTLVKNAQQVLGKDVNVVFARGFRTQEQQAEIYAKGRDKDGKIVKPDEVVTHAKPGTSNHEKGVAFDIELQDKDGKPLPPDHPAWQRLGAISKSLGLKWGGDWKGNLRDYAHFENPTLKPFAPPQQAPAAQPSAPATTTPTGTSQTPTSTQQTQPPTVESVATPQEQGQLRAIATQKAKIEQDIETLQRRGEAFARSGFPKERIDTVNNTITRYQQQLNNLVTQENSLRGNISTRVNTLLSHQLSTTEALRKEGAAPGVAGATSAATTAASETEKRNQTAQTPLIQAAPTKSKLFYDTKTGEPIDGTTTMGDISARMQKKEVRELTEKQSETMEALKNSAQIVQRIRDYTHEVFSKFVDAHGNEIKGRDPSVIADLWNQFVQRDPKALEAQRYIESNVGIIAHAMGGEKGTLTEGDTERAKGRFPQFTSQAHLGSALAASVGGAVVGGKAGGATGGALGALAGALGGLAGGASLRDSSELARNLVNVTIDDINKQAQRLMGNKEFFLEGLTPLAPPKPQATTVGPAPAAQGTSPAPVTTAAPAAPTVPQPTAPASPLTPKAQSLWEKTFGTKK